MKIKQVVVAQTANRKNLSESLSGSTAETLNIGDPVIITGNVQHQGHTGDIVDFDQNKSFVVVDLYNYGRRSFHTSDVSFNDDYAGSDREEQVLKQRQKFESQQGVAEGLEIQDVYNSKGVFLGTWDGNKLFKDLGRDSIWRDWEAQNGTDWVNDAVMTASDKIKRGIWKLKPSQGVAEGEEPQFMAATYIDEFGDGDQWYVKGSPEVIQRFVQLANSLEDEGVKGTEYEPGKGMMGKIHAELGNDSIPQWKIVKAQNLEGLKPIGNKVLQLLMNPDLSDGVQEFISDFLWTLEEKGLALVHGDSEQGVAETQVSKHRNMGATSDTTHFIKNIKTGEVVSPHRSLQDAKDALVAYGRDGKGDDYKIVRARKENVTEDPVSAALIGGALGIAAGAKGAHHAAKHTDPNSRKPVKDFIGNFAKGIVDPRTYVPKKKSKQGVAEGGILKSIKRGLHGWDKNAVGPGGEKLGDPKDIVQRAKAMDTDTAKKVRAGLDSASDHSPAGLQKRVLDRKLKGVAEATGNPGMPHDFTAVQPGVEVWYKGRFAGWTTGKVYDDPYGKSGKMVAFEPNPSEFSGDEGRILSLPYDEVSLRKSTSIGKLKGPEQGVAEGFSDVVKGIKRSIKGKEHPDVVASKHAGRAIGHYNQGDIAAGDKETKRYEKTRDMHLKAKGVAEGSLEEVDTRTLVNYVPKAGRTLASLSPDKRKKRSGMMTRAYQKLIPRPDFSDEIKKYQDEKNKKGVAEGEDNDISWMTPQQQQEFRTSYAMIKQHPEIWKQYQHYTVQDLKKEFPNQPDQELKYLMSVIQHGLDVNDPNHLMGQGRAVRTILQWKQAGQQGVAEGSKRPSFGAGIGDIHLVYMDGKPKRKFKREDDAIDYADDLYSRTGNETIEVQNSEGGVVYSFLDEQQGVAEGDEQKYSVTIDAVDHGVLGAITVSASNPVEAKQKVIASVKKSMAKRGYELMVRSASVKPVTGVEEGRKPGDIGNPSFSAFKRAEHEQEAQRERELERQRIEYERGPWFIILRGKPVSTGGQPKEFNHLKGAKAYFSAMMDRNPKFAEKIRTEYTAAADKNTVVYYSKTLPIESPTTDNQPNVNEEIITSPNFGGLSQQVDTKTGNTTLNYQAGPMQSQQTKDASGKVISSKTNLDLGVGMLGMGQEKGMTTKSWKSNAPADENPITSKDLYALGDKSKEATYDRAMNYVQQQKQPTREGRQDRETRDLFGPTIKEPRVDRRLLKPTVAPPSGPTTNPGPVIKTPAVDQRLLDPRLPPDTATPKTSPVIKDPGSASEPVMVFLSMKDSNYRNQFKSYRFPSQAAAERWANVNNAVIHSIKPVGAAGK